MDTYEQGKKITVKAEAMKAEAKEHFGQCKELTAAISDFFGSPVIGPVVFWFLHRIVALFTVSFFLYTLVAAVPTFSEKVTFAPRSNTWPSTSSPTFTPAWMAKP